MHLIDPQQRRFTDPITHLRAADRSPEVLIASRVICVHPDVREPSDPSASCSGVGAAAVPRLRQQINCGPTRLTEAHKRFDTALFALESGPGVNWKSCRLEL